MKEINVWFLNIVTDLDNNIQITENIEYYWKEVLDKKEFWEFIKNLQEMYKELI